MLRAIFDNRAIRESFAEDEGLSTAYLSTYPPRECGIATFCEDLVGSTVLHAPEHCTDLPESDGSVEFYWEEPDIQVGDWVEAPHWASRQCRGCIARVTTKVPDVGWMVTDVTPGCAEPCTIFANPTLTRIPSLRAPEGVTLKYVTREEFAVHSHRRPYPDDWGHPGTRGYRRLTGLTRNMPGGTQPSQTPKPLVGLPHEGQQVVP